MTEKTLTSVSFHKSCCIRLALHPAWLRYSSLTYTRYCSVVAPCHPGASRASMLTGLMKRNTSSNL